MSDISDHLPILTLLKQTKLLKTKPLEFESRTLTEKKIKTINQRLLQVDWSSTLCESSSDKNVNKFLSQVEGIMDEISLIKQIKISAKHRYVEPWMTRGLEKSSKRKHSSYKVTLKPTSTALDTEKYITYCNNFSKTKRTMHKKFYITKAMEFKDNTTKL